MWIITHLIKDGRCAEAYGNCENGFVADYLVQSKKSDAKEQVSDAIFRVEQILNELKRKMQ